MFLFAQESQQNMWLPGVSWWELMVRAIIVYLFLVVLLRLTGKRQVGQLAPFDLVLVLVLANAVQNSINAGDNSILGGLASAATLVLLNGAMSIATFRSKRLEALVEGRPHMLIHSGKIDEYALRECRLTHHELNAALRRAGCCGPEDVHFAVLENNGQISVIPRHRPPEEAAQMPPVPPIGQA